MYTVTHTHAPNALGIPSANCKELNVKLILTQNVKTTGSSLNVRIDLKAKRLSDINTCTHSHR